MAEKTELFTSARDLCNLIAGSAKHMIKWRISVRTGVIFVRCSSRKIAWIRRCCGGAWQSGGAGPIKCREELKVVFWARKTPRFESPIFFLGFVGVKVGIRRWVVGGQLRNTRSKYLILHTVESGTRTEGTPTENTKDKSTSCSCLKLKVTALMSFFSSFSFPPVLCSPWWGPYILHACRFAPTVARHRSTYIHRIPTEFHREFHAHTHKCFASYAPYAGFQRGTPPRQSDAIRRCPS